MATDTLSPTDLATQAPAGHLHSHEVLKQIAKIAPARLLKMAITLLVIVFLTQFLLIMAERGRDGLPAAPETASVEAAAQTVNYFFNHPATYYLHKADIPTGQVVAEAFVNSAELLLFSLGLATLLGVPLGVFMALSRRRGGRVVMLLVSVLGTSLPSFLLAMLLWIVNIQLHNRFATPLLPLTGSGLDAHIILPALVLMARPLAQIAQVTYVTMQDVMRQDFVRVAYAKGRSRYGVITDHALKNAAIPVLTTMGASLRFSLASLPIVESFFLWPGVGLLLLDAIRLGNAPLATDLIASLGFLFLLLNLLLDFVYPWIDARLRDNGAHQESDERTGWRGQLRDWRTSAADWRNGTLDRLRRVVRRQPRSSLPPLPIKPEAIHDTLSSKPIESHRHGWLLRTAYHNGPLLIGLALLIAMLVLVFWGD